MSEKNRRWDWRATVRDRAAKGRMFLWLDPIRLTQHGHPHPAPGRRQSRGIRGRHRLSRRYTDNGSFLSDLTSAREPLSPLVTPPRQNHAPCHTYLPRKRGPKVRMRGQLHCSIRRGRAEGPGRLWVPVWGRQKGLPGAANTPDMATQPRSTLHVDEKFLFCGRKSWETAHSSKWWFKRPRFFIFINE